MILNVFFFFFTFPKTWVGRAMGNETFYGDGLSGGQELQGKGKFLSKLTCPYLTKSEVKMVGYWQCSFFACSWTKTESRSANTETKNEANIHPS